MKDLQVAVVDSFWDSYDELPKTQRKKTREFITKFRQAPDSNAINYEKLNQSIQDNYRSVRIDQTYRAIVMVPAKGNVYVLLWVDHHDDCIQWAARTRCNVHPATGTLQIYDTVVVDEPEAMPDDQFEYASASRNPEPKTTALPDPIFNLDDTRLLGIGVPESMLGKVADLRSKSELETTQPLLPEEAFEALLFFHEGIPWDEIWEEYHNSPEEAIDTEDVATALTRDASRRRFKVVETELELIEMLNAPLEKWRVYLHPSQRRLVERDWNGPVRVLGGAGTGKTVVAMHRAAWLARQTESGSLETGSGGKILFLTFNTNLAEDIQQNLAKLLSAKELLRIEVINIDAWVARFLKANRYTSRIVPESELTAMWDLVLGSVKPVEPSFPDSFYKEEWMRIVLPYRIENRDQYFQANRQGRGVALNRKQRAQVWSVFDEMRSQMQVKGWKTYQDATLDAIDLLNEESNKLMYSSVVVDETQDMGSEALTLIRRLAPETVNDLFLVGDGHQRIYRTRAVMSHCGINIQGRGRKLKINYRTTEEIRKFATAFLQGISIDNLNDGNDGSQRKEYTSLTHGPEPVFQGFYSMEEEVSYIARRAVELADSDELLRGCCVVLRTNKLRDEFATELKKNGVEVVILANRANNQKVPGIRIASMHRVKGLEFRHVFLASMNDGVVPNYYSKTGSEDPTEVRESELNERALIHVASSRAIESLMVTWNGAPSSYLDDYEIG